MPWGIGLRTEALDEEGGKFKKEKQSQQKTGEVPTNIKKFARMIPTWVVKEVL